MAYYDDLLKAPETSGQPKQLPYRTFKSGVGFGTGTGEVIYAPTATPVVKTAPGSAASIATAPVVTTPTIAAPTGTTTPVTTPGSAAAISAGMYTETPAQKAERELMDRINTYNTQKFETVVDPVQEYQNKLAEYQQQINAINSVYADRLNQARVQGQGRIESRQFAQGRAGQIGSGTGEAGINTVQTANTEVENAIRNEQAAAIADVYAIVRKGVSEELTAKTKARQEGADALVAYLNEQPAKRKANVAATVAQLIGKGVENMTPEEIKSFADGLGVTPDAIQTELNTQKATKAAEVKKAENDSLKALPSMAQEYEYAKKQGYTGTFTQYQNEDANRKAVATRVAKDPSITEKQATTISKVSSKFVPGETLADGTPTIDQNGYLTPSAFKQVLTAAQIDNLPRAQFIKEFGPLLYAGDYSSYGLTPAEIKTLQGALPTNE